MAVNTVGTQAASSSQNEFSIEDDIMFVRIYGTMQVEDVARIRELSDELLARYGYILLLADGRYATGITHEARRLQKENMERRGSVDPSHTAIYGASTTMRLLSNLVQRGIALLSGQSYALSFVKSESEARSILDIQRALLKKATVPLQ